MKATPITAAAVLATAERYLTLREVAERLRCSRSTVWRLMNERGLRAVRCGGLVRVSERALQEWIDRHSTSSGADGDGQT
jgi:excisionase family DNA binding protein